MEKHTCKLCYRRFSSGRALGGHMRSHATAAALSDSSASSSSGEAEEKGSSYVLRENPRRSFRIVDPEFSSPAIDAAAASSAVVQDGESETESLRAPAAAAVGHGRRSKRPRCGIIPPEAAETVSSVSDATAEEDVAVSLMMLSRDVWTKPADDEMESLQLAGGSLQHQFRCEECSKVFRSYQALGGHRASHKKLKQSCAAAGRGEIPVADGVDIGRRKTAHECPVCFRVFGSGQALGGHKRSHLCSATAAAAAASPQPATAAAAGSSKCGESWIDLNLPAPVDDEAAEVSAVSDAEFVVSNRIA